MRCNGVEEEGEGKLRADVGVPVHVEVSVSSFEYVERVQEGTFDVE